MVCDRRSRRSPESAEPTAPRPCDPRTMIPAPASAAAARMAFQAPIVFVDLGLGVDPAEFASSAPLSCRLGRLLTGLLDQLVGHDRSGTAPEGEPSSGSYAATTTLSWAFATRLQPARSLAWHGPSRRRRSRLASHRRPYDFSFRRGRHDFTPQAPVADLRRRWRRPPRLRRGPAALAAGREEVDP